MEKVELESHMGLLPFILETNKVIMLTRKQCMFTSIETSKTQIDFNFFLNQLPPPSTNFENTLHEDFLLVLCKTILTAKGFRREPWMEATLEGVMNLYSLDKPTPYKGSSISTFTNPAKSKLRSKLALSCVGVVDSLCTQPKSSNAKWDKL